MCELDTFSYPRKIFQHSQKFPDLNRKRSQGSSCNVEIRVGQRSIRVHRHILEALAENYRPCLLDSLGGKINSRIDLTPITTDWKAVDNIVTYLYTGHIHICQSCLSSILKVASVLLMNQVRKICIGYMKNKLNLSNCLEYYGLAVEHNVPALIETIKVAVSKYHDPLVIPKSLTAHDVSTILKISSVLRMNQVRESCIDFMERTLDIDNCLKYYGLAVEHNIPDLEEQLKLTIISRLEDPSKDYLPVSPKLMARIMHKNAFEYCDVYHMLRFVVRWTALGKTDDYASLGCRFLDLIAKMVMYGEVRTKIENSEDSLKGLEFIVKNKINENQFTKVFYRVQKMVLDKLRTIIMVFDEWRQESECLDSDELIESSEIQKSECLDSDELVDDSEMLDQCEGHKVNQVRRGHSRREDINNRGSLTKTSCLSVSSVIGALRKSFRRRKSKNSGR